MNNATLGRRRPAWRARRGSVIVLTAILMVVLLGFIAFAVDCGMIVTVRTQLQNAADAGARAGASSLKTSTASAQTNAQTFAQANSVATRAVSVTPAEDIELGNWNKGTRTFTPLSGAALSGSNAVRVTCRVSQARGNALKLFFAPIFGIKSSDVSAKAVAINSPIICGPFVGLTSVKINGSYTDSYNSNNGGYSSALSGSQGHVCSNASLDLLGSSVIHGDAHPGPGYTLGGGGTVTGSTIALTTPIVEPSIDCGNAATVNNNKNIPKTSRNKFAVDNNGNFSIGSQDSLSLPGGTYYFSSFSMTGGGSLTISAKTTIYCTGAFDASGGTINNTTQLPVNCQLYAMGSTFKISGGSDFYGVLYAPTADITRTGNADFYGIAVGRTLTFSGSGGAHYDEAIGYLDGVSPVTQLVQ
jgi:Flp pilus assembly protein TadG